MATRLQNKYSLQKDTVHLTAIIGIFIASISTISLEKIQTFLLSLTQTSDYRVPSHTHDFDIHDRPPVEFVHRTSFEAQVEAILIEEWRDISSRSRIANSLQYFGSSSLASAQSLSEENAEISCKTEKINQITEFRHTSTIGQYIIDQNMELHIVLRMLHSEL